jgi:hypothetical protein
MFGVYNTKFLYEVIHMNNLWPAMPIIFSYLRSKNGAGSLRENINYFLIFPFRILATISRKLPDSLPWLIFIFLR